MRELQLKSDQKKRHRWLVLERTSKKTDAVMSQCKDCGMWKADVYRPRRRWTEWTTVDGRFLGSSDTIRTPACEAKP